MNSRADGLWNAINNWDALARKNKEVQRERKVYRKGRWNGRRNGRTNGKKERLGRIKGGGQRTTKASSQFDLNRLGSYPFFSTIWLSGKELSISRLSLYNLWPLLVQKLLFALLCSTLLPSWTCSSFQSFLPHHPLALLPRTRDEDNRRILL